MRFVERTLRKVQIAPRQCVSDKLGGIREEFSSRKTSLRCVIVPANNTLSYAANALNPMEHGAYSRQSLKLLLPRKTAIHVGDGICLDDEENPDWRCVSLERWSSHLVAKIERLA